MTSFGAERASVNKNHQRGHRRLPGTYIGLLLWPLRRNDPERRDGTAQYDAAIGTPTLPNCHLVASRVSNAVGVVAEVARFPHQGWRATHQKYSIVPATHPSAIPAAVCCHRCCAAASAALPNLHAQAGQ
jgi:hypothetical protein